MPLKVDSHQNVKGYTWERIFVFAHLRMDKHACKTEECAEVELCFFSAGLMVRDTNKQVHNEVNTAVLLLSFVKASPW